MINHLDGDQSHPNILTGYVNDNSLHYLAEALVEIPNADLKDRFDIGFKPVGL